MFYELNTYMCAIYINQFVMAFYSTQSHPFPTKPVPVLYLMNISVKCPLMKKYILNYPFGKHTQPRSKNSAVNKLTTLFSI